MLGLKELVDLGMAREIRCSNYATWRLAESDIQAETLRAPEFVSIQREYNVLKRGAESELVDACRHFQVTLIPYFPLASGLLRRGRLNGTERRQVGPTVRPAYLERITSILESLTQFAGDAQHSVGELAIAWLASQDVIGPVITSVRSAEQLRANAIACEWRLSLDEIAHINEITSTGEDVRTDDPFGRQSPPIAKSI